ncbi:interaptin-like isoform X4 [Hypanus sabinus]|uniref:interaptin-like isoform X4 n=1 Tax=Hypanus sabinus TaxID=79690 RepID=UPI0028C40E9A|nr:interaptin-like isoform X4 [Hypanus sabinus]
MEVSSDSGLVKCRDAAGVGCWWRDVDLLGAGGRRSALSPASGVRQNMKHLLNELRDMYEEKLRHMGKKDESKDTLKMKARILQSYINDLGNQNKILVQTIEDLEKEANEKIVNLDTRLQRDDQLLNEQQLKWEASKEEIDRLRGENMNVKIDLNTLVCAIQQAEKSQKFDFSSLNLRSIQLEKVASPAFHSSIIRKKSEISKPLLGAIFHLETNDVMGRSLHEELKDAWCESEQSELEPEVKEHRACDLEAEHQTRKTQAQMTALQNWSETNVNHKSFQQDQHKVLNKKNTFTELKDEMRQLQQQYNETVEENGRLQARLEAWMITAQSEHEILSKEVLCKEDIIHKLRMKQLSQDEKCNTAEEKIQHQETLLNQLHQKYLTAVSVVENQQRMIHSLEQDLQTAVFTEKEMTTGVAECEETIKHLEMELSSLHSAQELDNKTITQKKQVIHELHQESNSLKQKLKEALCKIHQKESKISVLEEKLLDARKQNSVHYEEFLHREKFMQKLKEETVELTDQIKKHSQDISALSAEKQKIELEMTVITEKYRTAQQEVSKRDEIILKLKTDLKTAQKKYGGAQEDIGVQTAELNRLTEKLTNLQHEVCKLRNIGDVQQEQLNEAGKSIQEFESERKMLMEEIQTKEMKIVQLHKDLDVSKQSYTDDLERWSQKNTLLQNSLDSTITELQDTRSKVQEYKTIGINLKEDLKKQKLLQQETAKLVEKHEDTIKKQKSEDMHLRKQIELLKNQVTESHNQALTSESTADLYKQKYQTSTDRIHHLENHVQNLKEQSNHQIAEKDEEILQLQSRLIQYQINHGHSNEEYDGQVALVKHLEKELELVKSTCNEKNSRIGECEQTILDLRAEITKSDNQQKNCVLEVQKLEQALQNLNLNSADSENKYKLELVQLQKQITQLESNLTDSQESCNQMQQAIWERDDLLQQREAELQESQENVKKKMSEMKVLDNIVTDLQIELQNLQIHKIQTQNENTILRADIQQLNQKLQGLHQQYREKAQKLTNQEEKLILLESNLLATEKQLNNQTSEAVHQEQKQQTLHMQIRTLKKQLETTEEEMNKYKQEHEELRNELNMIKQQQEILDHHDDSQSTLMELGNTKDQIQTLRQQIKEEEIAYLRNKYYNICLELMKEKSQVKDLQLKLATEEEKVQSHKGELEAQKQALEAAQSDNNRLQEESELMVSSVKEWITEQGHANNILSSKIQQQNQLVSRLTMDKVCLQETIKNLNQELKVVKTEMEEKKNKTEQLKIYKALQSHGGSQQILLNQHDSQLKDQEYEWANLIAEKVETIEDMHNRLKTSIQSMQLLHQQLHTLDRENPKHERRLEKEQTHHHQLELQLETLGQTIASLRTQLKSQRLAAEHEERICQKGEVMDSRKEWTKSGMAVDEARGTRWRTGGKETVSSNSCTVDWFIKMELFLFMLLY